MPKKGFKHSEETKKKIGASKKKNPTRYWQDKKRSEETKKKISDTKKKNPVRPWFNKKRPDMAGSNNPNWNGGTSLERVAIWNSIEYKRWREAVFERDNYTCQECGKMGVTLNAHHIKTFKDYPSLRFKIYNGITLCEMPCHQRTKKREGNYQLRYYKITKKC